MTLFFISLDPGSGSIQLVRAGHDPAMVYDPATGIFENFMGKGAALGVDDTFAYSEQSYTHLEQGKIIALGTDGIWESVSPAGAMYGKERLKKVIQENVD